FRPAVLGFGQVGLEPSDSHLLGNNNQFHRISPTPKVSGLPWREQALVGLRAPHALVVGTHFPSWGSAFHKALTPREACCVSRAAMCSAIITVVRCVLARGISGMTDASMTRSRSTPSTR